LNWFSSWGHLGETMALSEPSIEKEKRKQTTEEKLDGNDEGNVQVITGPTEIE